MSGISITKSYTNSTEKVAQAAAAFSLLEALESYFTLDPTLPIIKSKYNIVSEKGIGSYGLGLGGSGGGGGFNLFDGLTNQTTGMALDSRQGYLLDQKILGKADSGHEHSWAVITNKPLSFAPSAHSHSWDSVTDKPLSFAPSAHNHAISGITGLSDALAGKEASLGNPTSDGQIIASTTGGVRSWVNRYVLPVAAAAVLGGVMVGTGLNANAQGLLAHSDFSVETGIGGTLGHIKSSERSGWNSHVADTSSHLSIDDRAYFNKLKTYFLFASDNSSVHTPIVFYSDLGVGSYGLGSGGSGGGGSVNIIDNLISTSTTEALSANMGRYLSNLISSKSDTGHSHSWDTITSRPVTFTPAAHSHDWDSITSKPVSFIPAVHQHSWSEITSGKPTTLGGYGITDAISTANIGSQSVNYANSAGKLGFFATNETTIGDGFGGGALWINYRGSNAPITVYYMGDGRFNGSLAYISASGFIKTNSSSAYLLTGDGGHKAIADFSSSIHNHDGRYQRAYGGATTIDANAVKEFSSISEYRWTNTPYDSIGILYTNANYSIDWITQEFHSIVADRRWFRRFHSGTTWGSWFEFWHTGNFNPANYAPASGSLNYIWNQSSSAQSANIWINGGLRLDTLSNGFIPFRRPSDANLGNSSIYTDGTNVNIAGAGLYGRLNVLGANGAYNTVFQSIGNVGGVAALAIYMSSTEHRIHTEWWGSSYNVPLVLGTYTYLDRQLKLFASGRVHVNYVEEQFYQFAVNGSIYSASTIEAATSMIAPFYDFRGTYSRIASAEANWLYLINYSAGAAVNLKVGGLLVSGSYSQYNLVPANGIYSAGSIYSASSIIAETSVKIGNWEFIKNGDSEILLKLSGALKAKVDSSGNILALAGVGCYAL